VKVLTGGQSTSLLLCWKEKAAFRFFSKPNVPFPPFVVERTEAFCFPLFLLCPCRKVGWRGNGRDYRDLCSCVCCLSLSMFVSVHIVSFSLLVSSFLPSPQTDAHVQVSEKTSSASLPQDCGPCRATLVLCGFAWLYMHGCRKSCERSLFFSCSLSV